MRTFQVSAFILLVCSILCPAFLPAQEVEAVVTVNYDRLPMASQQELAGFGEELQRYINTNKWTTQEWKGDKVQLMINVGFTGSSQDGYNVTLVLGSQRKLQGSGNMSPVFKVLDDKWSFPYTRGQAFYQDIAGYDQLSSIIDFYVYISIGLELDTRSYLGGATMYDQARQIYDRGQVRTGGGSGWDNSTQSGKYSRFNFLRELTDLRYHPYRKFIYDYHHNALDNIAQNRPAAIDSANAYLSDLVKAINQLVEPSVIIRVMTDAKNVEFAELFTGYSDPIVWKKLLYIDPRHQSVYEAAKEKK